MVSDRSPLNRDRSPLIAPHARAHLGSTLRIPAPSGTSFLCLSEASSQKSLRQFLVLVLRPLGLDTNLDACRLVGELNGAVSGVPVLPSSPRPPTSLEGEVPVIQSDLCGCRLYKHAHGDRRRVNATALLIGRGPLPAMAPRFILERPLSISARTTEGQITGADIYNIDSKVKDTSVPPACGRCCTAR